MEPRYVLHEAVGVGGMGVVHRGTWVSPAGERAVAIKQLAERGRLDPGRRARLVAEARLVFRLTHANICQVLDLGESERGTFVVMELVRGCDLRALYERLREDGRELDAACALYVAREVARGLDYAHRVRDDHGTPLGLVHGDVTPQNVLLSVEGEVKLADFGIAHALDEAAPGTGLKAGTPGYLAPELDGGRRDHRLDIYSLGVTLLVTLTGLAPAAALAALPRLRELRPDVTETLQQILARATAALPEQRYASAAELERALSTELARRHPTFTPSLLAEVVRAQAPEPGQPPRGHDTLRSMTVVERRASHDDDAEPAAPPSGTQTAHTLDAPLVGGRRLRLAGAVGALVALAGVAWIVQGRARSSIVAAPPVVASVPLVVTPSAPPPVALAAPEPVPAPVEKARHGGLHTVTPRRRAEPAHAPPAAEARLSINANPWGAVLVDGREVAPETPLYRHALPAGDHVVTVRFADGNKSAPQRIHLSPGELRTLGFAR